MTENQQHPEAAVAGRLAVPGSLAAPGVALGPLLLHFRPQEPNLWDTLMTPGATAALGPGGNGCKYLLAEQTRL